MPQGSQPISLHSQKFRVEQVDTDATGHPQLASWIRWMEETEYGFLRSLGLSVSMRDERGQFGFPRQRASVEILQGVRFGDSLRVEAELGRISHKQIVWRFRAWRQNGAGSQPAPDEPQALVARGEFLVACCRFPENQPPVAILIPDAVRQKIETAGEIASSRSGP